MKKRGVSEVIATVLLILITIAAFIILWLFLLPMIKDFFSYTFIVDMKILDEGHTLWSDSNRLAKVQVWRGVDDAVLIGYDLIFYFDDTSATHFINESPGKNTKRVHCVNLTGYQGSLQKIKLAPVFERGKRGDAVSELNIRRSNLATLIDDDKCELVNLGITLPKDEECSDECVPTKTCSDYYSEGKCGTGLSNGCENVLNCVGCLLGEICNLASGECETSPPDGTNENPFQIKNCYDLNKTRENPKAFYILMNDIDCSDTVNWDGGKGWSPINNFEVDFDGHGFAIYNLYINRMANYQGLFSIISPNSKIKNLGVLDFNINGRNYVGGLVGNNLGTISNSYSKGSVKGVVVIGGLVGVNQGTISNSYSDAIVTRSSGGNTAIGGFVGYNSQGAIENSYSTGRVYYSDPYPLEKNGFVGAIMIGGNYKDENNFWDTQTSGQTSSAGDAVGRTTSQMKNINTFKNANWDIAKIEDHSGQTWFIDDGVDYPRLGFTKNVQSTKKSTDGIFATSFF